MKLTINLTDEQYAGLTYVANQSNAASPDDVPDETPDEYAQRIFSGVCDDYAKQAGIKASSDILEKYKRAPDNVKQAVEAALASVALETNAEEV